MCRKISLPSFVLILSVLLPLLTHVNAGQETPKLWAAISVNEPVFIELSNKDMMITFSVVNDSSDVVDPKTESSKIIVNGEVLETGVFANGIRPLNANALAPGEHMSLSIAMNAYFRKPGIYKVYWKGENFESQPIVLRILPSKFDRP